MQLLLGYFLSILLMVLAQGVIENHEEVESHTARHVDGMLGWIGHCLRNVPCQLKEHAVFVKSVLAITFAETIGVSFPGPPVLQMDVAHSLRLIQASQFAEGVIV